jgi:cytochrome c5
VTDKTETTSVRNWTIIIYTIASILILFLILYLLDTKLSNDYQEPKDLRVERIKPIGQVNLEGSEATATQVAETVPAEPKSGKEVYDSVCFACHASGVLGAPKFRDQADWASRIAKGKDVLLQNSINGLNAMPARGGNPSLTDEELQAAIDYMLGEE